MVSQYVTKAGIAVLRLPKLSDLKDCQKHINALIDEHAFIVVNKKVSLNEERSWLKNIIRENKLNKSFNVVVEMSGDVIGSASLKYGIGAAKHTAELGISLNKQYRNLGIGTWLIKEIVGVAKKKKLKIIYLTAFENNLKAVALYKKLGFREFGMLPKGVNHYGKLSNRLYMYRKV